DNEGNGANAPFDPAGLHAGEVFRMANMAVGIPIGEVASDPTPRRIVLSGFDTQNAIMRRVVPCDTTGTKIKSGDNYRDFRGSTIKREDIIYLKGWENVKKNDEEADKILTSLKSKQHL
ncbi:MAG: hypothetical protein M1830_007548, partial [Pleopsidium flavum]